MSSENARLNAQNQGSDTVVKNNDLLDVWVDDHLGLRHIGVLERVCEKGHPYQARTHFHYSSNLNDTDAASLIMPIRRAPYSPNTAGLSGNLPPIFDQNIPEGALRAYLTSRYSKLIEHMGDFDLLRLAGNHSIGRIRVCAYGENLEKTPTPETVSVTNLLNSSDSEGLLESLFNKLAKYSGVSGVQPKLLMRENLKNIKPSGGQRITIKNDDYIIKSSGDDYPWLSINEFLCMYAAMLTGLDTAQTFLSADGKTIAVKRFDRDKDSNVALGFEDMGALSGLTSNQKYEGSYEGMITTMKSMTANQNHTTMLEEVFKSVTVSIVLGNGDAHLKNFGFLYKDPTEASPQLAPAYDICCTRAYLSNDALALGLNGKKHFPGRAALIRFGRITCRLDNKTIENIFEDIFTGIELAAPELAYYANHYPEFGQSIAPAMQQIWTLSARSILGAKENYLLPGAKPSIMYSPTY